MKRKRSLLAWADSASAGTGFGIVSRHVLGALHATGKYDIDQLAINFNGDFVDRNRVPWQMQPAKLLDPRDPHGMKMFFRTMMRKRYDIVWILNDLYVTTKVAHYVDKVREEYISSGKKPPIFVYYYPVDCHVKPDATRMLDAADYVVCYTKHGREETLKTKPELVNKLIEIPHGVDSTTFRPLTIKEIAAARQKYFEVSSDTFIVVQVNRNSTRKQIPYSMLAFKEFKKIVPNSMMYIHAKVQDQGGDLIETVKDLQMDSKRDFIFPGKYSPSNPVPDRVLNNIYNCGDLFLTAHCFTKQNYVSSSEGLVPIEDIEVGDRVYTHTGFLRKVLRKYEMEYQGKGFKIRARNFGIPIECTEEHPFLTIPLKEYKRIKRRLKQNKEICFDPQWKKASELNKNDILVYRKEDYDSSQNCKFDLSDYIDKPDWWKIDKDIIDPKKCKNKKAERFLDLSPDLARFFGYYIAEGSKHKHGISFSFGEEELSFHKDVISIAKTFFVDEREISVRKSKKDKSVTINIIFSPFKNFFPKFFGKNAKEKQIPNFIFNSSIEIKKEFLRGLFRGDGTISNQCTKYKTVSKKLALQLQNLLLDLGITVSVGEEDNSKGYGTGNIYVVRIYKINDLIKIGLFDRENLSLQDRKQNNCYTLEYKNFVLIPIFSISEIYLQEKVFNLETEIDHTYLINNGFVVHNCGEGWGLSITEAMATGVPVVTGNNTCMPQQLGENSERGYLYECKDQIWIDSSGFRPKGLIPDIVDQMIEVYKAGPKQSNPKVALAREWAVEHDWKEVTKKWIELFENLEVRKETNEVITQEV